MNIEKKILLSCALFIGIMFGATAQEICPLTQVNREIAHTRYSIDSVRTAHTVMMNRQLQKNANYRYINENAAYVDTLPRENDGLMTMAVQLIRRKYPSAIVFRTPVLFIKYRNVPGVGTIGDMYHNNNHKIQEYNRRVAAFQPEYQTIKNKAKMMFRQQML